MLFQQARPYVARRRWSHIQSGGSLDGYEFFLEALGELA